MTAKNMFKELKYAAEKSIRNGENIVPYMSGTTYKKNLIKKMIVKYKSDAILDYELGVINEEIYKYEIEISDKMISNLECYFNII